MAIRYLYLNDNPAQLNLLVEAVKGGTEAIEIVASQAHSFDRQLKHLTDVLGQYDGLLLDWRLNNRGERHAHREQWQIGLVSCHHISRRDSGPRSLGQNQRAADNPVDDLFKTQRLLL